ncbi:hypothetical protein PTSG_02577 [Salpingoeca rosetta]|uniref:Uncharacterized protein n=1 Tax=Salpingoeca rosetta (strain ATCC 50818 / BSB-021) TaxID=946362 RepID=F2U2P7_SALR5|nr:uncharacterized protein PTSG_02577 [Salpingoeca rosetta]EGD81891.1 hypothetical protein PTSG_02577 [Salpingoeca rosetta]|eukprot:XP_004996074.1 hypothetical protein PTSG_02577 [Salpingoeca rosetta]
MSGSGSGSGSSEVVTGLHDPRPFVLFDSVPKQIRQAADMRVWGSAFGTSDQTKHLVAVVGGPHLCVCDCSLDMRPLFKYTLDTDEDLYCVSWGWKPLQGVPDMPIIAAAGLTGHVWVFSVKGEPLLAFRRYKCLTTAIMFHPTNPAVLFAGDDKGRLLQWNISWTSDPPTATATKKQSGSGWSAPRVSHVSSQINPVLALSALKPLKARTDIFPSKSVVVDSIVHIPGTNLFVAKGTKSDIALLRLTGPHHHLETVCHLQWPKFNEYYFRLDAFATPTGVQVVAGHAQTLYMYTVDPTSVNAQDVIEPAQTQDVVRYCALGDVRADKLSFVIRGVCASSDGRYALVTYDPAVFALWKTSTAA